MEAEKKEEKQKKPKPLTAQDILKYEIAEELGLMGKVNATGWKSLTARESGQIGGIMTKRKKEAERVKAENKNEVQNDV